MGKSTPRATASPCEARRCSSVPTLAHGSGRRHQPAAGRALRPGYPAFARVDAPIGVRGDQDFFFSGRFARSIRRENRPGLRAALTGFRLCGSRLLLFGVQPFVQRHARLLRALALVLALRVPSWSWWCGFRPCMLCGQTARAGFKSKPGGTRVRIDAGSAGQGEAVGPGGVAARWAGRPAWRRGAERRPRCRRHPGRVAGAGGVCRPVPGPRR